jgi:hypothetical protein
MEFNKRYVENYNNYFNTINNNQLSSRVGSSNLINEKSLEIQKQLESKLPLSSFNFLTTSRKRESSTFYLTSPREDHTIENESKIPILNPNKKNLIEIKTGTETKFNVSNITNFFNEANTKSRNNLTVATVTGNKFADNLAFDWKKSLISKSKFNYKTTFWDLPLVSMMEKCNLD